MFLCGPIHFAKRKPQPSAACSPSIRPMPSFPEMDDGWLITRESQERIYMRSTCNRIQPLAHGINCPSDSITTIRFGCVTAKDYSTFQVLENLLPSVSRPLRALLSETLCRCEFLC